MPFSKRSGWLASALAMLLALVAPLHADDAWPALTPTEKTMLAPFAAEWAGLDGPMRARLRVLAERWATLPVAARAAEIEKFRRWQALPPEQREQLRTRHRAFQQLDATQRARVRDEYQRWQNLSPRERRALRSAMGPQRPVWNRAVRAMDAQSRVRLREAVAGLSSPSRRALHLHLHSQDPAAAGEVLRGLLDTPASERAAYIERLEGSR